MVNAESAKGEKRSGSRGHTRRHILFLQCSREVVGAMTDPLLTLVARAIHEARFRLPGHEREPEPMGPTDDEYCARLAQAALSVIREQERGRMDDYQAAVGRWMIECFGEVIAMDPLERIMRFLEEALELAQAEGMTAEEVGRVTSYVYGRPSGETPQEVGGVMVTLAAFCYRREVDLQAEALREFDRIDTPEMRQKIFAKQAFKRSQGLTSDSGFRPLPAPPLEKM